MLLLCGQALMHLVGLELPVFLLHDCTVKAPFSQLLGGYEKRKPGVLCESFGILTPPPPSGVQNTSCSVGRSVGKIRHVTV